MKLEADITELRVRALTERELCGLDGRLVLSLTDFATESTVDHNINRKQAGVLGDALLKFCRTGEL